MAADITTRGLRTAIRRHRDRILDLDAAVDTARTVVDRAVEDLRDVVRERDRAVLHLDQLMTWHRERERAA